MAAPTEPDDARARGLAMVAVALAGLSALAWTLQRRAERAALPPSASPASPMTALGAQLLSHEMVDAQEGVVRFVLNGVEVSAASGRSGASLEQVLAAARRRCAAPEPLPGPMLVAALREARGGPVGAPAHTDALIRGESDGEQGFVTCLDRFAAPPSRGAMRYVYARRAAGGSSFVVVFTDAPVVPADLAPDAPGGDVRGADIEGLPRPPGAVRRLSFRRVDGRQELLVYGGATGSIEAWAMEALPASGWSAPVRAGGEGQAGVLRAEREGRRVYLVAGEDGAWTAIAGPSAAGPALPH